MQDRFQITSGGIATAALGSATFKHTVITEKAARRWQNARRICRCAIAGGGECHPRSASSTSAIMEEARLDQQ